MDIYNFMNQKLTARLNGEKTGMKFVHLDKIKHIYSHYYVNKMRMNSQRGKLASGCNCPDHVHGHVITIRV
jgi:hypothetical protein